MKVSFTNRGSALDCLFGLRRKMYSRTRVLYYILVYFIPFRYKTKPIYINIKKTIRESFILHPLGVKLKDSLLYSKETTLRSVSLLQEITQFVLFPYYYRTAS